ncbi:MAG: 3,4-dihydroxy-2-butanone 4-phosphate synthase [Holophagaceae bacterium]|nr:3,4-dihydroxy-2-butanone 4-phosphate synthase [Holophagaceae bacterium]
MSTPFATIEEAIEEIRKGRMVVVIDDEDRENEGDLTLAAQHITPEAIAFMATHGRGLICVAMEGERLDHLHIPLMVQDNSSPFETAFCVTVEAREGTSTGISAGDRAQTIRKLIDPAAKSSDFVKPGHMFPLRARSGGVLTRTGQTEASVDLARLAGLHPSGVICEIMKDDGTMARVPDLVPFCQQHGLLLVTVADLVAYRLRKDPLIRHLHSQPTTTLWGPATVHRYKSLLDDTDHFAFTFADPGTGKAPLVRVHLESLPEDLAGLGGSDNSPFHSAMAAIAKDGGTLVYLRRNSEAVAESYLSDREVGTGSQILRHLGIQRMRLLSRSSKKYIGLKGFDLDIVEQVLMDLP